MSETPTDRSGSSWFPGRRRLLIALAVVFVVLVGVVVVRSCGSSRVVRPDLGPGPVRGVRLTEFLPGEGDQTCTGIAAGLPVVRLVEQVNVEQMTVCLGPGRRAETFPLEPFVLSAADPDGERLLDGWAAAWSLTDQRYPTGGSSGPLDLVSADGHHRRRDHSPGRAAHGRLSAPRTRPRRHGRDCSGRPPRLLTAPDPTSLEILLSARDASRAGRSNPSEVVKPGLHWPCGWRDPSSTDPHSAVPIGRAQC